MFNGDVDMPSLIENREHFVIWLCLSYAALFAYSCVCSRAKTASEKVQDQNGVAKGSGQKRAMSPIGTKLMQLVGTKKCKLVELVGI